MKVIEIEVGFEHYEVVFGEDGELYNVQNASTGEYVSPHSHTGKLAIALAKDKLEGGEA